MGLSLLLAFSIVQPVAAQDRSSSSKDMKSSLAEVSTSKVNAKLTKEFEGSEYVTYLVKMKEQVDTAAVSKQAMQKASIAKETPAATKLSVRNSVVSSLRETASRTQYSIEHYLDKEVNSGKVKEYKSYFIVNSLAVTSTKEVMEQIALLPEVEKILPNETRYLQRQKSASSLRIRLQLLLHRRVRHNPRRRSLRSRTQMSKNRLHSPLQSKKPTPK